MFSKVISDYSGSNKGDLNGYYIVINFRAISNCLSDIKRPGCNWEADSKVSPQQGLTSITLELHTRIFLQLKIINTCLQEQIRDGNLGLERTGLGSPQQSHLPTKASLGVDLFRQLLFQLLLPGIRVPTHYPMPASILATWHKQERNYCKLYVENKTFFIFFNLLWFLFDSTWKLTYFGIFKA